MTFPVLRPAAIARWIEERARELATAAGKANVTDVEFLEATRLYDREASRRRQRVDKPPRG